MIGQCHTVINSEHTNYQNKSVIASDDMLRAFISK